MGDVSVISASAMPFFKEGTDDLIAPDTRPGDHHDQHGKSDHWRGILRKKRQDVVGRSDGWTRNRQRRILTALPR